MKRVAVLGSTGSIGRQTLEVVRQFPQRFHVAGLAAGRNAGLLRDQIAEFKPDFVSFAGPGAGSLLASSPGSRLMPMEEMAAHPGIDLVVMGTSGNSGLLATVAAVRAGKNVALASKEALVSAGEFIMPLARQTGAAILPMDSEHSAIWQCLRGEDRAEVSRIILTASGGPFRELGEAELARVTPEQALQHPTWQMGVKVTIDSATLLNKGMEVSEAHWLFDVPFSRIEVLVHPQSVVHSLVEFNDGSTKAQLGPSDMRLPIQHALAYPERLPQNGFSRLDWDSLRSLTFSRPDTARFPCLRLAVHAGQAGGTYPAVLCGADDVAVELFLDHRIGFGEIAAIVDDALGRHQSKSHPSLDEIIAAEEWARQFAREWGKKGQ